MDFTELDWHYDDLRIIDPVDAESNNMDIIAVYIKEVADDLSIRLDMLEMDTTDQQEIILGIDYKPTGSNSYQFDSKWPIGSDIQWDIALAIPAYSNIKAYNSKGELISGIKARVLRDSTLDTVTINISKQRFLPDRSPFVIEVLILDPLANLVIDRIEPFNSRAIPPNPARLVLGFYNTSQAYSPAQALRMWDGAHTGPLSSRHGLHNLINSAVEENVNVILFDLFSPISVNWLSYLKVYQDVVKLVKDGYLGFDCFIDRNSLEDLGDNGYAKFINQTIENNLSTEFKKRLVDIALKGSILFVIEDLSSSAWGNPVIATSAFEFISNHPWIVTLNKSDIPNKYFIEDIGCAPVNQKPKNIDSELYFSFRRQYSSTPDNVIKELALESYSSMLFPVNPQVEPIIENYFFQLGHILYAAEWVDDPYTISTCEIDIDWDEQNECILSSDKFYLTFELTGGYLAFAFFRNDHVAHQIFAPMSEVMIGLGDPSMYNADNGIYADPSLIPGTLTSPNENDIFDHQVGEDFIEIFNEKIGVRKAFRIINDGIQISWKASQAMRYTIPFGLDPWLRFHPKWADQYFIQDKDGKWIFGIENHIAIEINSSPGDRFDTFLDSRIFIGKPEDPNFEYPPGHYLPFPFATLSVSPSNTATITINIIDPLP